MKKQIFISLIFTISFSCATNLSMDEQIEAIKKAPESKRVKLMNQFKRQLVLMNQEDRAGAIAQLKSDRDMTSPPIATESMIDRVQSGGIEHSIQMSRDIAIREEIHENIKIPNIPNTRIPSVEQTQEMPSTQNPSVTHSQEIHDSPNPASVEQSVEVPNTQSPSSSYTQEIPNPQTSTPIEQSGEIPTAPTTGQPQGMPNTPSSNSGGI